METMYTKTIHAKTLTELEMKIKTSIQSSSDVCLQARKNPEMIYTQNGGSFEAELIFGQFSDYDPLVD